MNLNGGEDSNGGSVLRAGLESPLRDGGNGFRIETKTGRTEDAYVLRMAAGIHFDRQNGGSGKLGRSGLLAI